MHLGYYYHLHSMGLTPLYHCTQGLSFTVIYTLHVYLRGMALYCLLLSTLPMRDRCEGERDTIDNSCDAEKC